MYKRGDALLMLVSAFGWTESASGETKSAFMGRDLLFKAYREAMEQRYRFYSFGDAMMIV